jgi:hypothetical protein
MAAPPAPSSWYSYDRAADSRLVYHPLRHEGVVGPASRSTLRTTPQALSTSALQCTINLASPDIAFSRSALRFSGTMRLRINCAAIPGTPVGQPICVWGRDLALRDQPVSALVNSGNVMVGSAAIPAAFATYKDGLDRVGDVRADAELRGVGAAQDRFASLNVAANTLQNPISGLHDASCGFLPAGSFVPTFCDANYVPLTGAAGTYNDGTVLVSFQTIAGSLYLVNSAVTQASAFSVFLQIPVVQELPVGPFSRSPRDDYAGAITGVSTLQLQLSLQSAQAARLLRWTSNNGFNVVSYALDAQPFASPQFATECLTYPVGTAVHRPAKMALPYWNPVSTPVRSSAAFGASTLYAPAALTMQSPSATAVRVPRAIIVYAQPAAYAGTDGTWFYPIQSLSVNAFNQPNLLSDASSYELFRISARNGYNGSLQEWQGVATGAGGARVQTVGGVAVITPGIDFPLPAGVDIGSGSDSYNIQVQATFADYSGTTQVALMNVVFLYEDALIVADGAATTTGLSLTTREVLDAPVHAHRPARSLLGGSLWSLAKAAAGHAGHAFGILGDAAKAVGGIHAYVDGAGKKKGGGIGMHRAMSLADRAM